MQETVGENFTLKNIDFTALLKYVTRGQFNKTFTRVATGT